MKQTIYKINYYRSGATSQWEDGIEFSLIVLPPAPSGWEIQSTQPPAFTRVNQRAPAIKGKSEFAIYSQWINMGWEIQPYQPPFYPKTSQKTGALSYPEGGIESKFIPPFQIIRWGYELPPHLRQKISNRYLGIEGSS